MLKREHSILPVGAAVCHHRDMTTENVPFGDPDLQAGIKFSLNNLREEIVALERASEMPASISGTQLEYIEQSLGQYSYVKLFRRHMTLARESLREGARYLKVYDKPKPRLAPIIIARCALENAGIARWVSESTPEKAIERRIDREFENISSERKMLNLFGAGAPQHAQRKKEELLAFAENGSIPVAENKNGVVLVATLTNIMEDLDEKYKSTGSGEMNLVKAPWSLASAFIHGSAYPTSMLRGLTIEDDQGELIGVHPVIVSGFLEAAKNSYQEALECYRRFCHTRV